MSHTFTADEIRRSHERRREKARATIFDRCDRSAGPDGCWPWLGRMQNGAGYPVLGTVDNGKVVYAHRYSLELKLGRSLLPGELAMHSCDNPPCVNPSHLSAGTVADNSADMVAKGRPRGRYAARMRVVSA